MSNNNNIENEIKNNFKINLFDFNKIFEIDYDLDKIINYVLKKGNFLQNNRQINIKKIEEEYKEDYKRNCGFKERLDSVITISFDDLKKNFK